MADMFAAVYDWITSWTLFQMPQPKEDIKVKVEKQIEQEPEVIKSDYQDVIDAIGDLYDLEEAKIIDPKIYRRKKRNERRKIPRRRSKVKQDRTDSSANSEWEMILSKTPGTVAITGPLAKMNVNSIFETIRQEMKKLCSLSHEKPRVIRRYTRRKFNDQLAKDQPDLAFVHLIQCHRVAEDILGNKEYYSATAKKMKSIHEYDVQNVTLIECMANYHQLYEALGEKNYGEANYAIEQARSNLQSCPVGAWTAGQYELEGGLFNMFAYIWPLQSEEYHEKSFDSFKKSRDHFIEHDKNMEGSYSWVYCLFQMHSCLLQFPLRKNIQFVILNPPEKRLALLHRRDVSLSAIYRAEKILQKAKKEFLKCDAKYNESFRYNLLLAEIGLELRWAQNLKRQRKNELALDAATKGLNSCKSFITSVEQDEKAHYLFYIRQWVEGFLKEYLEELRLQLVILCEKKPSIPQKVTLKTLAEQDKMYLDVQGYMQPSQGSSSESIDNLESDVA